MSKQPPSSALEKYSKADRDLKEAWTRFIELLNVGTREAANAPGLKSERLQYLSGIAKFYLNEVTDVNLSSCELWIKENTDYSCDSDSNDDIYDEFVALMKNEISNDWTEYLNEPFAAILWRRAKTNIRDIVKR